MHRYWNGHCHLSCKLDGAFDFTSHRRRITRYLTSIDKERLGVQLSIHIKWRKKLVWCKCVRRALRCELTYIWTAYCDRCLSWWRRKRSSIAYRRVGRRNTLLKFLSAVQTWTTLAMGKNCMPLVENHLLIYVICIYAFIVCLMDFPRDIYNSTCILLLYCTRLMGCYCWRISMWIKVVLYAA